MAIAFTAGDVQFEAFACNDTRVRLAPAGSWRKK